MVVFQYVEIIIEFLSRVVNSEIFISITTSLIAGYIFYYLAEYRPANRRKTDLYPIIMDNFYWIHFYFVIYFDEIFKFNMYSSLYDNQAKIISGQITLEELRLALSNKCMNETYRYGEFSHELIIIGPELLRVCNDIKKIIRYLDRFAEYLSPKEVVLFHKMEYQLDLIPYNNPAEHLGLVPVNPTMVCYANIEYDLYKLFVEFQKLYYCKQYDGDAFTSGKIRYYMTCGDYKIALEVIKAACNNDNLWEKAICLLELGEFDKSKEIVQKALEVFDEKDFVGYRKYLFHLIQEEKMRTFIYSNVNEEQLKQAFEVLQTEKDIKEEFYKRNRTIMEFYMKKR